MTKNRKTSKPSLSTWGKIWRIMLAIAVPLGGGIIVSLFTRSAMDTFGRLNQPPLSPPAILFPIAWTILYVLMGLASYIIWLNSVSKNGKTNREGKVALTIYGVQLALNFAWSPLFFNAGLYWFAFAWLMVMIIFIIALMAKTFKISRAAFFMLLPYILWCCFAAYLNCGIALLN